MNEIQFFAQYSAVRFDVKKRPASERRFSFRFLLVPVDKNIVADTF